MKKIIGQFLNNNIVDKFLIFLISANLIVFVFDTDINFHHKFNEVIRDFELISVSIFSIEFILRLIILKNIKELFKPLMIIDFLAIAPFYLSFITVNTIFLRALRLVRLLRIFKIGRYTTAFDNIKKCLLNKKDELTVAVAILLSGILLSSVLIYYAENAVNPKQFPSIISSFWWSVVTFTSVGYGDVCPVTSFGKLIGSFTAIMGVCLHGLLVAILGAAFMEMLEEKKQHKINKTENKDIEEVMCK